MHKWMTPGAQSLIKRILDPNPKTRITIAYIKVDEWFKHYYTPAKPNEDEVLSIQENVRNQILLFFILKKVETFHHVLEFSCCRL